MKRLIALLFVPLGGCVLMQFATDVDLTKNGSAWFLYVNEPTSKMELVAHSLIPTVGNVPNRYRIATPRNDGKMDASELAVFQSKESGYTMPVDISGGSINIEACRVTIDLLSHGQPLSFNGNYQIPSWSCKQTKS